MATYIIVGVCVCFLVAVSLREIFRIRTLTGETPKEWLEHQYDYDIGFSLLFKKAPNNHIHKRKWLIGTLGKLLLFFILAPCLLGLLASTIDGTLTLPDDDVGFFEDYLFFFLLVTIASTFYLMKRAMDLVPETFNSVLEKAKNSPYHTNESENKVNEDEKEFNG